MREFWGHIRIQRGRNIIIHHFCTCTNLFDCCYLLLLLLLLSSSSSSSYIYLPTYLPLGATALGESWPRLQPVSTASFIYIYIYIYIYREREREREKSFLTMAWNLVSNCGLGAILTRAQQTAYCFEFFSPEDGERNSFWNVMILINS
jgi:hypothetical protein